MSRAWTRCLDRRRRGSITIEAVLALPIMLIVFGAVVQIMVLGQARLYVEQAAYAAARSALVYKCPAVNPLDLFKSPIAGLRQGWCQTQSTQTRDQKITDAARWALVPVSSTNAAASNPGSCPQIPSAQNMIARDSVAGGYPQAVANSICYAFDPGNVTVTTEWIKPGAAVIGGIPGLTLGDADKLPVRATVTFRYPLVTPIRRMIATEKSGGMYFRTITASVVLM